MAFAQHATRGPHQARLALEMHAHELFHSGDEELKLDGLAGHGGKPTVGNRPEVPVDPFMTEKMPFADQRANNRW
jgi:hypothetical protein